jgi:hypothetical protein
MVQMIFDRVFASRGVETLVMKAGAVLESRLAPAALADCCVCLRPRMREQTRNNRPTEEM